MVLLWDLALFALGIGLLVKGADWLVDSSARIAKQFGVSNFIIGLTIVALGTSLPEFGAAVTASFYGNSEIVLGNILGSNIANIALILGLAGIFTPIAVKKEIYLRDGAVMIFASILFYLFSWDGVVNALEGGSMLFLFLAYLHYFFVSKESYRGKMHFRKYLSEYSDIKKREKIEAAPSLTKDFRNAFRHHFVNKAVSLQKNASMIVKRCVESIKRNLRKARERREAVFFFFRQAATLLIGMACVFFGGNLVVSSALALPISPLVTSLILIAIGTSLPELMVTISSLRKGLPEIMIGNLIGSNIANIFWIGGIAAVVHPISVMAANIGLDFIFMMVVTWLFLVFMRNDYKVSRLEAFTLLLLYALFISMVLGVRVLA